MRELLLGVRDQRISQSDEGGELSLLRDGLHAQAGQRRAELGEVVMLVAEGARLRCTAARAGDQIPASSWRLREAGRVRIDEEDEQISARLGEIDRACGRLKRQHR